MANSREQEEYRMYFQILIDDIRFSKKQQWKTIYLTLVAIGAILGIFLAVESKANFLCQHLPIVYITPKSFLTIICIIVAGVGIMYIGRYCWDIQRYRYLSMRILRTKFSKGLRNILNKDPDWYTLNKSKFIKFLRFLKFFRVLGFLKSKLRWKKDYIWFSITFSFLIVLAALLVICIVWGI
jgi:hypothetical protein